MAHTVNKLYQGLLTDPEASEEVLAKILDYALRTKDVALLSLIANHPHLTAEMDERIAPLPYAKVKAAWAGRPGRATDVLDELARTDKRVAVLEVLATMPNLSATGYAHLTKVESSKVALALLVNNNVPFTVKQSAARSLGRLAASESTYHRAHQRMVSSLVDQPELHDDLGSESTSSSVMSFIAATPEISPAVQMKVVAVIRSELDLRSAGRYYGGYIRQSLEMASKLAANPGLSAEAAKALKALFPTAYTENYLESMRQGVLNSLANNTPQGPQGISPVTLARTTTSPEVLLSYAEEAKQKGNKPLATAVVTNPIVTAEMVDLVAKRLDWAVVSRLLTRQDLTLDVAVALMMAHPNQVSDAALARTGAPVEALKAFTRRCVAARSSVPYQVALSKYVSRETVLLLPVGYLATAELPTSTRQTVARALELRLGSSQQRWEIFESVGENFEGSLEELLETVMALHPLEEEEAGHVEASEEIEATEVSETIEDTAPSTGEVGDPADSVGDPADSAETPEETSASTPLTVSSRTLRRSSRRCVSPDQLTLV